MMGETQAEGGDEEAFSVVPLNKTPSLVPKNKNKRVSFSEEVSVENYASAGAWDQANDASSSSNLRKVIVASMVGNVLEWYDFGVFAYFAPQIGAQFFPKGDSASSVLNAFVVFGGGFFFRPLGGLIFGHVGDKHGRKRALFLSVVLMAGWATYYLVLHVHVFNALRSVMLHVSLMVSCYRA
jgi:hypothetical protein